MAYYRRVGSAPSRAERLSRISHDFRSGLYVIIGASEMLLEETVGKINAKQRLSLNDVREKGQRLLSLIDQLEKSGIDGNAEENTRCR